MLALSMGSNLLFSAGNHISRNWPPESEAHKRRRDAGCNNFIYLCNCVFGLNDRQDSLLLDGGRFLESESVDAAQDFLFEPHVVKIINFQFPVRFEKFFSFLS